MRRPARYALIAVLLLAGCSARGSALGAAVTSSSAASAATSATPPAGAPTTSSPSAASPPVAPTTPAPASAGSASTSPVPILGESRGITKGYGSARPGTIFNGGDPTGLVTGLSWQSWGGAQAVGSGMSYYDPPNVPVSKSVQERATVVAFDLGTCDGKYMYQAIEWYFPQSGGAFDPNAYLNVCSWTYHPPGGP